MFKIKFIITYDGTKYFGWQRQPNQVSIQETIENALSKILNQKICIDGAGRTDRGVHAKGQVAIAEIPKETNLSSLFKSLNSLLPDDIIITQLDHCDLTFHPRFSAKGKIYRYSILTKSQMCPFSRHTKHHHPYPIDLDLIKEAIPLFTGRKDFSSFANYVGKNSNPPSPIKTIFSIKVEENESGFSLIYHGDGFLYKMVRNITGALIDYGQGKLSFDDLRIIIEKKKNAHRLYQAPARGLCLESVLY